MLEVLQAAGFQPGELFQVGTFPSKAFTSWTYEQAEEARAWVEGLGPVDCYLCCNPLARPLAKKAKLDDIGLARCLLVDVDPEKTPDDPQGTDPEKREQVEALARKLHEALGGALVDGGRGWQVWVRLPEDTDRKAFLRGVRRRYSVAGCKIDPTHNADRLMRLPGTTNTRTDRVARLVATAVACDPALVAAMVDEGQVVEYEGPPAAVDWSDATEADRATYVRGKAKVIWEDLSSDRSVRDARFTLELLKAGCAEEVACRLLYALPGGKASTDRRGEDYWQSTFGWAKAQIQVEERYRALLAAPPTAETVLGDEYLTAYWWAKREEPTTWAVARGVLQGAKVMPVSVVESTARNLFAAQQGSQDWSGLVRTADRDLRNEGWWLRVRGDWVVHPYSHIQAVLTNRGADPKAVIDQMTSDPWTLVSIPFQPEELEGKRWNRQAARFKVKPEPGDFPTWTQVLDVCGRGADDAARAAGYESGAHYLTCWVAALVQRPEAKTAYLFFYGKQNKGKSTFSRALDHLFTGCVEAKQALTSEQGFNGELEGAVLCRVEEVNLSRSRGRASERAKDWTTSEVITIHPKGVTPFDVTNYTHWIHTANKPGFCVIETDDTRVTVIRVEGPRKGEKINRDEIHRRLADEAPAFLAHVLGLELPALGDGRLIVPALDTPEKRQQQEAAQSELDRWMDEHPEWVGMTAPEIHAALCETLSGADRNYWTRARVESELPLGGDEAETRLVVLQIRTRAEECGGKWRGSVADLIGTEDAGAVTRAGRALKSAAQNLDKLTRGRSKGGRWFQWSDPKGDG